MNNIIDIKEYLKNKNGVNKESFEQSFDKHFASVEDLTVQDLKEREELYENYNEEIVNKELGGIIEFKKLAYNPQEIIARCESQGYGRSA